MEIRGLGNTYGPGVVDFAVRFVKGKIKRSGELCQHNWNIVKAGRFDPDLGRLSTNPIDC